MTSKVFSYPVNPYSATPVADALAYIAGGANVPLATVTAYIASNPNAAVAWNDPCLTLGHGTGRWQFSIIYREFVSGETEPNQHIAFCGANGAYSNGGPANASCPSLTSPIAFTMLGGPISRGGGSSGPSSAVGVGGMSILRHYVSPSSPTLIADMIDIATTLSSAPPAYRYWNDPQLALWDGSGQWIARAYAWVSGYLALVIVESSGCALQSANPFDRATPPPASFPGWTQVNGIWQMQ